MTRVFLIRHGHVENPGNLFYGPETPLSEQGKRQITSLGEAFKTAGIQPDRIVSSPYLRARQSAEQLLTELNNVPLTFDERLIEWQVGSWFGKPLKEFYEYTKYHEDPTVELPSDIEPLESCAARVHASVQELVAAHQGETIFMVSHREPMVCAILKYEQKSFAGVHALHFPKAAVWELVFEDTNLPLSCSKTFDLSNVA